MANKRKTGSSRRSTIKRNTEGWLLAGVVVWLIVAISIFFRNQTGFLGDTVGAWFYRLFGLGTPAVPVFLAIWSVVLASGRFHGKLAKNLIYLTVLFFCFLTILGVVYSPHGMLKTAMDLAAEKGNRLYGPGMLGALIAFVLEHLIGAVGVYILTAIIVLLFGLNLADIPFSAFIKWVIRGIVSGFQGLAALLGSASASAGKRLREKREARKAEDAPRERKKRPSPAKPVEALEDEEPTRHIRINNHEPAAAVDGEHDAEEPPRRRAFRPSEIKADPNPDDSGIELDVKPGERIRKEPEAPTEPTPVSSAEQLDVEKLGLEVETEPILYSPPPVELLKLPKRSSAADEDSLLNDAKTIEKTLLSFGIDSEVVSINRGPTVTCFELKPAAGVKVNRISALADDLALALAAVGIRIEAPIPGKPYVGIEVPNREKDSVLFREILETPEFRDAADDIPIALGKSITGEPVIAHIRKMPHLLIAGATGSGKSVCINTLIMSILYKYTPQDVRMILIDPKVVELSVYGEIPHLLIPVVTDPRKASKALYMAVQEMERRFKLFSEHSVRDISGYREKAQIDDTLENLPFIVVIVDELSDLMMVASKDVEAHITRLAQMARACGIHLIIATQRPSVDVITGTIKANIPSRMSFQVSSAIDSRTILDMAGAEKLLGKGDMLYYPASFAKPQRVQCAFISDSEVANIVSYIKEKNDARYDKELMASIEKTETSSAGAGESDGEQDELIGEVLEFISHEETTSISGLQRRFRIGYSRAGRIIDELEAMGAVSPQDGSKPRSVLIKPSDLNSEDSDESRE